MDSSQSIILADTHGHLDAGEDASVADCDLAVHGGDIGNADVLARLRPRQGKVIAVTGNNDSPHKWPPEEQYFPGNLRKHENLELRGGSSVPATDIASGAGGPGVGV